MDIRALAVVQCYQPANDLLWEIVAADAEDVEATNREWHLISWWELEGVDTAHLLLGAAAAATPAIAKALFVGSNAAPLFHLLEAAEAVGA